MTGIWRGSREAVLSGIGRCKIKRSRIQILLQRGVVAGRRYWENKVVLESKYKKYERRGLIMQFRKILAMGLVSVFLLQI